MKEEKLGRNDLCHCGSGLKYKKCHLGSDLKEGKVYYKRTLERITNKTSLDQNTLQFISFLRETFNIVFNHTTGIGLVKGKVTKEKIRQVYKNLPAFFPRKSQFRDVCGDISKLPFSGLYWGSPNINNIASHLARYALYIPHIVLTNPFCDLMLYHREASPIDEPEAWMQVCMNQALYLISIEDWIKEGIISVLPPLRWFETELFDKKLIKLAEERVNSYDEPTWKRFTFDGFMELLRNHPPQYVDFLLNQILKGPVPLEVRKAAIEIAKTEYEKNPIRYKWVVPEEGGASIMKMGSGNNLEAIMFTSQLCASCILFGEEGYRHQYDKALEKINDSQSNSLTELSRAFADLEFSFLNAVTLEFVLNLRKDGRLLSLRNFLLKLWNTVRFQKLDSRKNLYKMFSDEIEDNYETYKKEWEGIVKSLKLNSAKVVIGSGIAVLTGQIGFKVAAGGLAAFGLQELLDAFIKRTEKKKLPLGVFLDLEKRVRSSK